MRPPLALFWQPLLRIQPRPAHCSERQASSTASGREPRSEPRQEEGIMLTRRVRCSHRCISCDMHRLSAALRRLSARHATTFLMPLPAATPMHSPVRLHPEAPSTRALMPTRISASPPPIASSKERPALEDHEPGVSATRRRRAPERAQTSKGSPPESVQGAQKGPGSFHE